MARGGEEKGMGEGKKGRGGERRGEGEGKGFAGPMSNCFLGA